MAKNILIVEDDSFLLELLSKKVLSEGFNVFTAMDGQRGIEKAKEIKPDLVVLDILLPDINGLEVSGFDVLSEIKNDKSTALVPVIMLSNLSQQEDIERCLKLGASDFLIKAQFNPEEIVEKINTILNKK